MIGLPPAPKSIMVGKRELPARRWLSIALRSVHLAGVVLTAVAVFGTGASAVPGVAVMLLSGLALYAIDLWQHPRFWREIAGAFVLVKLVMLVVMVLVPAIAGALFWLVLISSSVVSHAPRVFRHKRILG